ncbi:hypothetical protein SSBR45G_72430 [Bradyrhizobium sp. SSBR45G]|uniref:hypothetical protein n=1 Tax=unclassified Bradyrhizobium TaxID=2631580 RepID=UPI002342B393|nr:MULTISPECIES: hypothetical protein [unclassified Bradyrhizobium]GLH82334.1 hypothetical protein SSBR45G_72430 [Bradyrhizobium sp. SSBR45G]GLH89765.1 hypothetical protein SSBR45R_72260 [Bradyrhizobium sp. SSBR45R]
MPHIAFLERLRRWFGGSGAIETIAPVPSEGRRKQPAHPMSDQELSRAIRELRSPSPSEARLEKLARRPGDTEPG